MSAYMYPPTLLSNWDAVRRVLYHSRDWHRREQLCHDLHPAVSELLCMGAVPANWHRLCLEWPHVSSVDSTKLSFTASDRKGREDRQEPGIKPGRYIKRHFPLLSDSVIRDVVARNQKEFCITRDMGKMLEVVQNGPYSCMKWEGRDPEGHPYQAYDPELGWGMCYEVDGDGKYLGRALIHCTTKCFVRTFQGRPEGGRSSSHPAMESWLVEQGYDHADDWGGLRLAKVESPYTGGYLLPYIDGDIQNVTDMGDHFRICADGELECTNTDGTAAHAEPDWTCHECGEGFSEDDDYTWVGRDEDERVCSHCLDRRYTNVIGGTDYGHTREYYVRVRDVIEIDGVDYDEDNLPDFIMELHDGKLAHEDNCVRVERLEGYYLIDDCVKVDGDWEPKEDCVEDYQGNWILEENSVVLGSESANEGEYALRDDCTELSSGWALDNELEDCQYSGITTTESTLIDVNINDEDFRIHPSKLAEFLQSKGEAVASV